MTINIYVDGAGGSNSGYGYYVQETGDSFYKKQHDITNNQAEYLGIISALEKFAGSAEPITIFSDSQNTVNQLNHKYAINNDRLRDLARQAWLLAADIPDLRIVWIPRKDNLAGKMLGS